MGTLNVVGVYVGNSNTRSIPQQLGAILYIPDLITPVNGYWQDKSGKNKLVQAATTTVANDSLIMPANDADIIAALTLAGAYSKYYTNNATPKTVLISQIASIDSKYCVFFDTKTKTKFSLFKTQGDETRADKMYEFTFKAYTGGYFPITQTSDSISFVLRGGGDVTFEWGDGSFNTYTLSANATTVSKTWTTNIGGQKNINITSGLNNIFKIDSTTRASDNFIIRISNLMLTSLLFNSSNAIVIGSINRAPITELQIINSNAAGYITGDITGEAIGIINLVNAPHVYISGSITGKNISFLSLLNVANSSITGSINNMSLTFLRILSSPQCIITGNIETCITTVSNITVQQPGITYGGGATKAWNISQTIQAGWTSAMVDAWFNAYRLTAPTVTAKTLNLAGTNQAPTAASAAARTTITGKGFLIIIN